MFGEKQQKQQEHKPDDANGQPGHGAQAELSKETGDASGRNASDHRAQIHSGGSPSEEQGGLDSFVSNLHEAWREAYKTGDLSQVDRLLEGAAEYFEVEQRLAKRRAEGRLDLADALAGQPNTPQTQERWLPLMDDLNPGPYSRHMISRIGELASEPGPIRNHLLNTQQRWADRYGGNPAYAADLASLNEALRPKGFLAAIGRIFSWARG